MATSLEEQIRSLTMISDAQREKINQLRKNIDILTEERDMLLERVTLLETQMKSIEASTNE